MSAEAIRLLAELERAGIALWAEDGQLRFRAPKGRLTEAWRAELAAHRGALLALLDRGRADGAVGRRPGPAEAPVPLSIEQRAVWLAEQHGGGRAFLIPGALRLRGRLDAAALRLALQALVDRHEAFRTAIRLVGDEPMQCVQSAVHFALPEHDLSALMPAERDGALERLLAAEAARPFELARAPLLRAVLVRLAAEEHVLALTPHHIVADGWSIDVMVRELSLFYRPDGSPPPPLPAPLGYPDFAAWQAGRIAAGADAADLDYWRATLAELPPPLELPAARQAAAGTDGIAAGYAGAAVQATLPAATARGLRRLAAESGTTLFSALAALFAALLQRYGGRRELVLGTASAGRGRIELEEVVGLFAGRLPLRLDFDGDPAFAELVRRCARASAAALSHALPAERILAEAVAPEARGGLFQVMLALQNAVRSRLDFAGLAAEPLPLAGESAKFELFLAVDEDGEALTLALEYATARFDAPRMRAMLDHLVRLAEAAVTDPAAPLSRLPLMSAAERAALLAAQPAPAAAPAAGDSLWRRLRDIALAEPGRPALLAPLGWNDAAARSVSYGELLARAGAVAAALAACGLRQGEAVALAGERSVDFVAAMLGILAAGGCYLPLAPELPPARVAEMREDSGAAILVGSDAAGLAHADGFATVLAAAQLPPSLAQALAAPGPASATQRAYVMFTSGSTGRPKGVQVSHANVLHFAAGMPPAREGNAAVYLHFAPEGFDASVLEIWSALLTGARLVIAPPGLPGLDALADLIEAQRVSVCFLTAGLFHQLARARPRTLARLDILMSGGDRVSPAAAREVLAAAGPASGVPVRLYNVYGPTETTVLASQYRVMPADVEPAAGALPIGRAHGASRLYVLDRHGEPVPAGVIGELYIGGGGVAGGYLGRPELSRERFLPDPFAGLPGARMYRSGDLARWRDDGALEFLGRADRQVKIRGFRIEPGEIEAQLAAHPEVAQAVVEPRDSGGGPRLVAYLVPAAGAAPDHAALRAFLAERLPRHMLPAALVTLAALPLTRNGKLDRAALPPPDEAEPARRTAPEGERAEALAAVWRAVLQCGELALEDDFYALGGDSIMAMQVSMRLTRQGWTLRPQDMLRQPTLAAQCALMRRQAAAVRRRESDAALPVTPIQAWFFALELAHPQHWNQAVRLALDPAAAGRLEPALAALEAAHEALRLRFAPGETGWTMRVAPAGAPPLRRVRAEDAGEALVQIEAAQRSLDLAAGPVWRALLIDGPHDGWPHLVLIAHHLVVDGVSWRLLVDDLAQALAGGEPAPAALGYADWAAHLAGLPPQPPRAAVPPAPPPIARPDGDDFEAQTRIATLALPMDATAALLGPANQPYRSEPTELLLAGLLLGLQAAHGRSALAVALERHGRDVDGVELAGTVGWFTAIVPLLLALPPALEREAAGPGAALLALKQAVRSAPRTMAATAGPAPLVAFNYLGRFDNALAADGPLRPVAAECGAACHPANRRPYPLEIVAVVEAGTLRVDFRYGPGRFEPAAVEAWAAAMRAALLALLDHLAEPAAGGRAPCDFPLAGLADQAELDQLLREQGLAAAELADLLPVTPQQRGMLLESQAHAGLGLHVEQFVATFDGAFDRAALEAAWARLVARHDTLRSGFAWRQEHAPLCLVHARAEPAWQHLDWRGEAVDEARIAAWLERDRLAGFDGARPPLRFATLRLDASRWLFVWTYHHALLDGWSVARLLAEALAPAADEAPPAARDHARWLAGQDRAAAAAFWRAELAGAEVPTPAGRVDPALAPGRGHADRCRRIDAATVAQLETLARRHRLTPALLAQGLWGLALAWASGRREVTLARTVAGRPAEVDGSERWVGLFINSLPLRLSLPADGPLWDWLAAAADRAAAQAPYEWCAGGDVHAWSGLPPGRALSDTLLIFENYPNSPQPAGEGALRLAAVAGRGARTHFPLALLIVPEQGWRCELVCDQAYMPADEALRLLDAFAALAAAATGPAATLEGALARLPAQPPRRCRPAERRVAPPEGPLELELARLWEDLLGLAPIGRDDGFFALGGHSLLVLELMARLRARFGRAVPFAAFLRAPTVAGLAALLGAPAGEGGATLQPLGQAGPPLYLVPGASGNPLAYLPLARALDGRHALIGAQAEPAGSIEATAAALARAIAARQPDGPIRLAGHSYGAALAFETACQLGAAGREVSALVLLDSAVPDGGAAFAGYDDCDWIAAIAEAAGGYFGQPAGLAPPGHGELRALAPALRRPRLLAWLQAIGALPASAAPAVIDELLRIYRDSVDALARYRAGHWPGALAVIRAGGEPSVGDPAGGEPSAGDPAGGDPSAADPGAADPSLGWSAHCARVAATPLTAGDHIGMVTAPFAEGLAARLAEAVAACEDAGA